MDTNSAALPTDIRNCTLSELFLERKIFIPDLQRDYCWGLESTVQALPVKKAEAFVGALIGMHARGRRAMLGMLYGYEHPQGSGCIHIIDGQQRLTTIFLLIGMLYRRLSAPELRRLLVGDGRPRLLYQAKREALHFMADLVERFFLDRNGRLSQIEASDWYYKSYDNDANAQAFLGALREIDQALEWAAANIADWDFAAFARFVTDELQFVYCGLEGREPAERLFITINTTGQPLTLAQALRTSSLSQAADNAAEVALKWNDIEDWFWGQSQQLGADYDDLLSQMIALYLATKPAKYDFGEFYAFYLRYARAAEACGHCGQPYPMLACMAYADRWGQQCSDGDIADFRRFLDNIALYQKPAIADAALAEELAMKMPGSKLTSMLGMRLAPSRLVNTEERAKLELIASLPEQAEEIKRLLRRADEHPLVNGRASRIIAWSIDRSTRCFDIEAFDAYIDGIYRIWGEDIDRNDDLDDVRRALLAVRHTGYPIVRRGDSVLSLCWHAYDWQRLYADEPGLIRQLVERASTTTLAEIANRFTDKTHPYYFIIKQPRLLANCRKRQLLRPCAPFLGIYDLAMATTRWWVGQHPIKRDPVAVGPILPYGSRCLYADHKRLNIAVDLCYSPDQKSPFRIELFSRPELPHSEVNLSSLLSDIGLRHTLDKRRQRLVAYLPDAASAARAFNDVLKAIAEL